MPERLWVVNASPIISLCNIEHADILSESCSRMVIPKAVKREILNGPGDDSARQWMMTTGMQWVQDIGPVAPLVAGWDLGAGESEVLSWSYRYPAYASVIDDLAARRFAQSFGISLCGTVGVIVIAKKKGIITKVKPLLERLIEINFRIDRRLYHTALKLAGEAA